MPDPLRARRLRRRYGHAITPARLLLVLVAAASLFGCTKGKGVADPQRIDGALGPTTTTTLPFSQVTSTTLATTTTSSGATTTSTSGGTTTTTTASASATTRTTRRTTTSVILLPPSTSSTQANLTLDVTQGTAPCPALQLPFVARWGIGNAAPGTGLLSFDNETPRQVPDTGREERCVVAGTHSYTYSGAVPGGRATRTATFSWS